MLSHMLDASRQQFSTRCVAIVREGYEPSKARGQ
jgi:uncharacterized radical SAM superfamily protein